MRYSRQGEQFNISQAQSTGILWDQRPSILLLIVNDVINPNRNPWASKAHLAGPTTVGDALLEIHGIVWPSLMIRKRVGVICKENHCHLRLVASY